MSRVSLQNGGGPGSSISLAPETIKVRNALIEKFTGEPLDEMNHFMNTALATEHKRIAADRHFGRAHLSATDAHRQSSGF